MTARHVQIFSQPTPMPRAPPEFSQAPPVGRTPHLGNHCSTTMSIWYNTQDKKINKNNNVNDHMINNFPGESRQYLSSDTIADRNDHQYPQDFLNTLKKYCPIMLLRNFDPANGHCNGTRYTVTQLNSHVIEVAIAIGPHSGKNLFISRIPLVPSDNQFPFQLRPRQFPIKQAFSFQLTNLKARL
ncbi:uncharacterized protein LOC115218283 [Octopus sinensis]|uniref:Uncharacterized protein LOC115218283 n=1 Tax=Octopus sinensis TaxID=2607531 RepID=A0A6P7SZT9_9MOLL|nr:uncharacterized protein LOC115218283 [Octopus sinensis]